MRLSGIFAVLICFCMASSTASASMRDLERKIDTQAREIEKLKEDIKELKEDREDRLQAGYDHGFFIRSADGNYLFKIRFWADFFYQYDHISNAPDVNTFGIRRARPLFSGHVFGEKLTYAIMPEMVTTYRTITSIYITTGGDSVIIDDRLDLNWRLLFLWAQYKFNDAFIVRIGEFVAPTERFYRRTNVIFMGNLPLISITEPFVAGFHLGMTIFGTMVDGKFRYDVFAVNGTEFDRLNINKSFLTGLRLTWTPLGYDDLSTADVDYSEKPVLSFSGFGSYDKADGNIPARGNRGDNAFRFGADVAFKYKGFSFIPEFLWFWNQTQGINNYAVGGQAGYFLIPHRLELATQASYINFEGPQNDRHEYSAGVNYYFYGQPVKIQTDYSFLLFKAPGPDTKDHRFRINLQMGFF